MFPFQVDLSRLSYATALDLIAPVLPGGTIALGWLYSHQSVWSNLHDERVLKMIIAGFAIYVVGFVTLNLTSFEVAIVALLVLLRRTELGEPWKNKEWRRIVSKFIGSELCPPIEEPPAETPVKPLPFTSVEKFSKAIKEHFARALAPVDFRSRWQAWYEIMRAYFPINKDAQQQAVQNLYFGVFHAIGWAGLIAAYISDTHVSWLVWSTCILIIAFSHIFFTIGLSQQNNPDPSGNQLAAEILKAIKAQEQGSRSRESGR